MNKLIILCFALIMSCTTTTAQKSEDMQTNGEILASESQGGAEKAGFKIISDQQQLRNEIIKNFAASGTQPVMEIPVFPKDKKVVLYNLGTFNSGDHKVSTIKSISVKNNILYVEIPEYQSGGMAIQVMSNPWFIFSVSSTYQFTSVELKYSK
ncbi:hypothetical protein CHRY9390_00425 [Chryseobacterium aquaeductus]|uniref:Lipoprotein n=1 Tax=Chryseobacterium aquaeductus TaxID=2675056 RepID=A0A9N8MDW0_9FLAO|nr:hypothetical protein [Chryseobacterium aquaeductus]CAA7329780.1 hypothetical protein CHRY9390_00425 [Chryseobacterium potabilaquae]CAD7799031.1 hypothetical protein CHRY9390_00425 [Chryseobacterium aquaeductus]